MTEPLRFGILGTGNIAGQFADGVTGAHRSAVVAVGSRRQATSDSFAAEHGIAAAYGSYEALLSDERVKAVYVALPNSLHHKWTLAALAAGKHVLCEKPIASNAAEAEAMFDAADVAGRVLVEAFMYRSHPLTRAVIQKVRSGAIGRLRMVRTSFCFPVRAILENIRFKPDLAGGALMDIGCYCIDFSRLVTGAEPTQVRAVGSICETGVDDQAGAIMLFPDQIIAQFICGMASHMDNAALISGDQGYIRIPVPWKPPMKQASYTVASAVPPRMDTGRAPTRRPDQPQTQTFHVDADRPLYALEADAFAATVQDGAPPAVARDDPLSNMRILDDLRRQVGLAF